MPPSTLAEGPGAEAEHAYSQGLQVQVRMSQETMVRLHRTFGWHDPHMRWVLSSSPNREHKSETARKPANWRKLEGPWCCRTSPVKCSCAMLSANPNSSQRQLGTPGRGLAERKLAEAHVPEGTSRTDIPALPSPGQDQKVCGVEAAESPSPQTEGAHRDTQKKTER